MPERHGASAVVVVVLAFEAATTIEEVLDRLPHTVCGVRPTVLVADDASTDGTSAVTRRWADAHPEFDLEVVTRSRNLGYGGNQQAAYRWAADRGAEVVVLLHADGQYPPEQIEDLVRPILDDDADVVFGSRMVLSGGAIAGGMPWERYVGNRSLSWLLNRAVGSHLTEWYSGFRAYRVSELERTGFEALTDGFDFDAAVMVRFIEQGAVIGEVPIPTRYAGEISRVPLLRTGLRTLGHGLRSLGRRLLRDPRPPVPPHRAESAAGRGDPVVRD